MPFLLLLSLALPASILTPRPLASPPCRLRSLRRRFASAAASLAVLLSSLAARAQTAPLRSLAPVAPGEPPVAPSSPVVDSGRAGAEVGLAPASGASRRWGLETDLAQPLIPQVHIFTLKLTRTLWGASPGPHGDGLVGAYLRPRVETDVVERIDEYLALVGYRQYLWRGLHVEVISYLGYAWGTRNKIDGRDHRDVAWLLEGNAGYRFTVVEGRAGALYVGPQAGYLRGLHTNIGPRHTSDAFVTGKLLVGAQF